MFPPVKVWGPTELEVMMFTMSLCGLLASDTESRDYGLNYPEK
jgi:hypothetical protein